MENFIRQKYGDDVFFITAMAAVFQSDETEYLQEIKYLIHRENITDIFILNDTSCRFINSVLKNENGTDTPCEKVLQQLLKDNATSIIENKSLLEQQIALAGINVKHQAKQILKSNLLQSTLSDKIKLTALVATRTNNNIIEININN